MLNKEKIKNFFDEYAPRWDDEMIIDDRIVEKILDNAGVSEGKAVLDVACGTGVLVPYYLARGAGAVTGIDISPEMIKIAAAKFAEVSFICADAENYKSEEKFDSIVIYNAFPHFSDPERLIKNLSGMLKPGGLITVAHGMSRERINSHHKNVMEVSNGLISAEELAAIFKKYVDVTTVISTEEMYQVAGTRLPEKCTYNG